MAIYAYIRVSTNDKGQTTDNQKEHIENFGFSVPEGNWYSEDGVSGTVAALDRPAFSSLMQTVVCGDTVICTMLDRLGRNALDILTTVEAFKKKGVKLRVMQLDGVDLTSSTGKLLVGVLACLAEIDRVMISERTKMGMARTAAAGTKLGQPLKAPPEALRAMIEGVPKPEVARQFGMKLGTLQKVYLKWGGKYEEYVQEYAARNEQYNKRAA